MANVSSSNGLEKRPKLRFPGFDEPWSESVLGSFLHERNEYAEKDGSYEHATLSKDGIYGKTARYDRDFLVSTENKKYKVTHYNDLCYNPANLKFGVICLNKYGDAIFSPIYVTFEVSEKVDVDFIGAYLTRWDFINRALRFQQGTVYERMAVSPEDFLSIRCYLPLKKEQIHISSLIRILDKRIEKQQRFVDALKKYKRGAVSRLLNGTLTFNDCSDTESWQLRRVGDFCEVQMCKRVFKEQTTPDGDVPFYKIGTIGGLPDAYISRFLYEDYKRKYSFPRKGEFLISCAGTVGKCVLYNGEDAYYQDSNLVWLRNNSPDVFNDYLFVLVSNVDWTTLNSTTITRIYNDNLRDLRFYIPPMQIQKRIVDYIFTLSSRIDIEQMTLDKLQQERMGLLQQLFI